MNVYTKIPVVSIVMTIVVMVLSSACGAAIGNYVFANVFLEICILITQIVVVKHYLKSDFNADSLGLSMAENFKKMFLVIGFVVGLCFILSTFFALALTGYIQYVGFGFSIYKAGSVIVAVLNALIIALSAGVCEEVFFRGVVCNYINKAAGNKIAALISSALFSVFHMGRTSDFRQFIFIFLLGMILSYFFLRTTSLYVSMAVHFGVDFGGFIIGMNSAGLFVFKFKDEIGSKTLDNAEFITRIIIIAVLVSVWFLVMKIKNYKKIK